MPNPTTPYVQEIPLSTANGGTDSTAAANAASGVAVYNASGNLRDCIIQTVQTTKTDAVATTVTAGVFTDIPGMSAAITCSSTSSKVLIFINLGKFCSANGGIIRLLRNDATITGAIADSAGSRLVGTFGFIGVVSPGNTDHATTQTFSFLDSPASVSALTYHLEAACEGTTMWTNRSGTDSDSASAYHSRATSNIILLEISG